MKITKGALAYVDEARGIAILMVILVHTSRMVTGLHPLIRSVTGYCELGVQLFFVASAYTLCRSFEKNSHETFKLTAYFIRRYWRIAPLYYAGIVTYLAYFFWYHRVYMNGDYSNNPYGFFNIAANLVFIHGFVPAANNDIVPGGWSVGTEMAFYLIFPMVFKVSRAIGSERPARLLALVAGCIVIDLLAQNTLWRSADTTIGDDNFAYFNIVNQLSAFEVGIFAYYSHQKVERDRLHISRVASITGFVCLTLVTMALRHAGKGLYFAIIPLTSASSFYCLLNLLKSRGCSIPVLVAIGRMSYSMYIFHFLFVWGMLGAILVQIGARLSAGFILVSGYCLVVSLSFGVALVTETFIERRGIMIGQSLIESLRKKFPERRAAANQSVQ